MIGKIRGKIDSVYEDHVIVDVNGVGYQIFCSTKTLSKIQDIKEEIAFIIETVVREDYINLYGFLEQSEKEWFNQLCKVNGVGNKMALKILGLLTIDDIINAINSQDKKAFCRVSGVGPRLATRIITELKNVVSKMNIDFNINTNNNTNIGKLEKSILGDAVSALENLGYQRSVFYSILVDILNEKGNVTLESLITTTLRKINSF